MAISIKLRKYFYWSISFISITIILMIIYHQLGGFMEISAGKSDSSDYSIAGTWVKGKGVRKQEAIIFNEMKKHIAENPEIGDLCMVNYKNDTLEPGESVRLIGIMLHNQISAIPSDLEIIELSAEVTYKAALTMHPLVMPNTEKVEQILLNHASGNGDSLLPLTIEIYYADNSVIVEMFKAN